jgi:hypothetical protein
MKRKKLVLVLRGKRTEYCRVMFSSSVNTMIRTGEILVFVTNVVAISSLEVNNLR